MGCRVIKTLRKFDHITEAMKRSPLAENSRAYSIQNYSHNLPMCQWLSSIILNWLTRPQPHEKEFKIRYSRKTSNTTMQISHKYATVSIRYAGPRLWNELPQNIREAKTLGLFKILLKTYLFSKCYDC